MALILPGSAEFKALTDPRDKHSAVREALESTRAQGGRRDVRLEADLRAAELHYRATAALLYPVWDFEHNLILADKKTNLVLFKPNAAQLGIIEKYEAALASGRQLRLLLPKSRQHGVSQGVAGIIYRHTRNAGHFNSLVMAHEVPAAKHIFKKYVTYHSHDPFKPDTMVAQVDELHFTKGGKITVRTAGGKSGNVGRGDTLHAVHLTEPAFYPDGAYDTYNAIMEAVVRGDDTWSMVFIESTGNGQQGLFYDMCMRALHDPDSQPYDLLFLPWTIRFDATLRIETPEERKSIEGSLNEEERLLRDAPYNATLEQIKWRRETLKAMEGSDSGERLRKFRQEHPKDLEECFQAYGGSVFDGDLIRLCISRNTANDTKRPPWRGDIVAGTTLYQGWDGDRRAYIHDTPLPSIRKSADGKLTQWFTRRPDGKFGIGPVAGRQYTMGVDIAEGTVKGDFSVISVFDRTSRRIVARWRGKMPPEQLVHTVRLLSKYFNDARICCETNFYGTFVNWLADTDRQPFLYVSKNATQTDALDGIKLQWGWRTTATSKRHLISVLRRTLEMEPEAFTDTEMLREALIFKEALTAKGSIVYEGAPAGGKQHDDIVIATALAIIADEDMPHIKPEAEKAFSSTLTIAQRWERGVARQKAGDIDGIPPDPLGGDMEPW